MIVIDRLPRCEFGPMKWIHRCVWLSIVCGVSLYLTTRYSRMGWVRTAMQTSGAIGVVLSVLMPAVYWEVFCRPGNESEPWKYGVAQSSIRVSFYAGCCCATPSVLFAIAISNLWPLSFCDCMAIGVAFNAFALAILDPRILKRIAAD